MILFKEVSPEQFRQRTDLHLIQMKLFSVLQLSTRRALHFCLGIFDAWVTHIKCTFIGVF